MNAMTPRLKRPMLVLGTVILVMQVAFMPIGTVYTETTMVTEEHEPVEFPFIQNSLEELTSDSNFFFPQPQIQGRVEKPLKVTFFSDQDVLEAQVLLPKEATIIKDQLPEGTSVVQGEQPQEWLVQSELAQKTFDLPLIFDTAGNYEISIGEATMEFEIGEKETKEEKSVISEGVPATKNIMEDDNKEINVVGSLGDSVYRGTGRLVNGLPEDPHLWVPGTQVINSLESDSLEALASQILVNGNRVTEWQLSTLPYLDIDAGNGTGVVEISGVGSDLNGDSIDVRMTVTNILNFGLGYDWLDPRGISLATEPRASRASARVTFDFLDTEGNLIDRPIYQNFSSSAQRPYFTFNNSEVYSILSNDDVITVQEEENKVVVRSGINEGFNLITKSSFSVDINLESTHIGQAYNLSLFTQQSDGVQIVNNPPKVVGHTVEEIFESNYTMEQEVTNFITSDFIVEVDAPEILQKEAPVVGNIVDSAGKVLDWATVETVNGKTTLRFPFEEIKQYEGKLIKFDLFYKIDKYENPKDFLDGEGYLAIPLTARTNYVLNEVRGTAKTWAKPWGEAIPQNVVEGADTLNLDPTVFVKNLSNKLLEDTPFVVGFEEEKVFESLGEETIEVIIESALSGIQTNITVPVTVVESSVSPVDPLDPVTEVDPENTPELPENQGPLSIDFVSSFNFSSQAISVHDKTYYAQSQRLLNEDGTVNETEERPNYIQVSDRRPASERNGWQLAVTQKEQFSTEAGKELAGAQLQLSNQQVIGAQNTDAPSLQLTNPLSLIPGNKRTLIRAEGTEGMRTWIYRFGDENTADKSVALEVPKGATPDADSYSTTLIWELSVVPANMTD